MRRTWIPVVSAVLLLACQQGTDPESPAPGTGTLTAPEAPSGGLGPSEPPAVDALAGLDDRSRAAVAESPVKVLLFGGERNERSTVMAARGYYAIHAREGEVTLSLHATDIVHHAGDGVEAPEPDDEVRGHPALILVNEGIRSVTWQEDGTSYVVEVECYRPFEDERCTESAFVLEVAQQLVEVSR